MLRKIRFLFSVYLIFYSLSAFSETYSENGLRYTNIIWYTYEQCKTMISNDASKMKELNDLEKDEKLSVNEKKLITNVAKQTMMTWCLKDAAKKIEMFADEEQKLPK